MTDLAPSAPFSLAKGQKLSGSGALAATSGRYPVTYEIHGPSRHDVARGFVRLPPEDAEQAFRYAHGWLTLESGAEFAILLVAHTRGQDQIFFEMHRLRR